MNKLLLNGVWFYTFPNFQDLMFSLPSTLFFFAIITPMFTQELSHRGCCRVYPFCFVLHLPGILDSVHLQFVS